MTVDEVCSALDQRKHICLVSGNGLSGRRRMAEIAASFPPGTFRSHCSWTLLRHRNGGLVKMLIDHWHPARRRAQWLQEVTGYEFDIAETSHPVVAGRLPSGAKV